MYEAAIRQLTDSAEICENNAPIHEAEGRHEQSIRSRANAASYRQAIVCLRLAQRIAEPVLPQP